MKPVSELINLNDRTAIVTGGAVGIGLGVARRLIEAGANVIIADIDQAAGQATVHELGDRALFQHCDVSDEAAVKDLVAHTVQTFGGLHILVNNAGIYPNILLANMTTADFDRVLSVNLRSAFLCTKYASEYMMRQGHGGRIINITSVDALHPSTAGLAHYDASKHGLWGFTKNAALELAEHQIWVNAVAPGGIATPGVQKAQTAAPESAEGSKMLQAFLTKIPMQRLGEPDDIGKAVLFLASDLSSYMTGSQIVVDGGMLLA